MPRVSQGYEATDAGNCSANETQELNFRKV